MESKTVDARGMSCPLPIVRLSREMKVALVGQEIVVLADDEAFPSDVEAWCKKTRQELLSLDSSDGYYRARVRKAVV